MNQPPLLTLSDVSLTFGGAPLFSGVSCAVGPGDRIALVGRNGSGKSTLLKMLAGDVEPDAGERFVQPGAQVGYLPQDPDLSAYATLGAYAAGDLDETERHRAEAALDALDVDGGRASASASGGERRRAAIARVLAAEPDLLLLDEPTNHLDIRAIAWLEDALAAMRTGFVLISHDRAFLSRLTRATLWIDRGRTRRIDQGFAGFEAWRDKTFEEEAVAAQKLDAKIRREEHWVVHGVSGRRKRNVRRMAELDALKEARRTAQGPQGRAALAIDSGQASGKLVIEAREASKRFGDRVIVDGFSIKIARGDRVAFVGPNGVGKTTLLKMLIGEAAPDSGSIRLGANLDVAVFDQTRAALDPEATLWETLTDDKALRAGGGDQVMVRGRPKHVVGYLKEFLFDERQARGPVSALSGGERARLLLAKILARPSNLLVLDEPTNDLDVETLDLLQELLSDFDGTLLLVSHDRDFLDRVAATTIAMEGDGRATVYAGGWTDYRRQRSDGDVAEPPRAKSKSAPKPADGRPKSEASRKLSYKDARRLEALPDEIAKLEDDVDKLQRVLATPNLYAADRKKFDQASALLADRQSKLSAAEEEWITLETLREEIEAG